MSYTTGVYFCACVKAVLCNHYGIQNDHTIMLPNNTLATIPTTTIDNTSYAIKAHNDDLDVTIGCKIIVKITQNISQEILNDTPHNPTILSINNHSLSIYAGCGLGVATKKGLKIKPNSIAINPTPLSILKNNIQDILKSDITIVVSIENGKEIAKNTANHKVGIIGGLSILGTSGIVKPVSSLAYIDSIKEEISVIANYSDTIAITLGNSAYTYATKHYYDNVVDIGNYIKDSIDIINKYDIKNIIFITSIAKMTKVAQGYENTHNRFGDIDFVSLVDIVQQEFGIIMQEEFVTVKAISEYLSQIGLANRFCDMISLMAQSTLARWTTKNITTQIIEANNGL